MSPEAQRIAIAEACGWTEVRNDAPDFGSEGLFGFSPEQINMRLPIPAYIDDLNAMLGAEEILGNKLFHYPSVTPGVTYEHHLKQIAGNAWYRATAAQRAEAFLRTLNLWKP